MGESTFFKKCQKYMLYVAAIGAGVFLAVFVFNGFISNSPILQGLFVQKVFAGHPSGGGSGGGTSQSCTGPVVRCWSIDRDPGGFAPEKVYAEGHDVSRSQVSSGSGSRACLSCGSWPGARCP